MTRILCFGIYAGVGAETRIGVGGGRIDVTKVLVL